MNNVPDHGIQLTSTLYQDGTLELKLVDAPVIPPGPDEVVIRVEASPINPSDLMTMMPAINPAKANFEGSAARPVVTGRVPPVVAQKFSGRFGKALTVGLEGAGTVIAAGDNATNLLGHKVSVMTLPGGMYCQYCTVPADACVSLPEDTSTTQGAALFCNPLTALAIVETVRLEGYRALIHTAAASNLGQMLVRICLEDNIPLVNIVRRPEQEELLRKLGATHVCNSASPGFREDLIRLIKETRATVAFDAVGGGEMADQLLSAMEAAAVASMEEYSPYGSAEQKRVYIYGRLDKTPLQLGNSPYGMLWDVGGWAMTPIMERSGPVRRVELLQRVLANIKTTFASSFKREISLADVLNRENMVAYQRQATGEKYLINPML